MNLSGDAAGLAALKAMQETNREYLKFLIHEARSVFEHHVDFKAADGAQFRLSFDPKTGAFKVDPRSAEKK
ncbi:MAG TPA: hypothetical protein VLW85_05245 [Myxococcales bacterium]|nr:hypothetical protein [Myxococcales bacterium]